MHTNSKKAAKRKERKSLERASIIQGFGAWSMTDSVELCLNPATLCLQSEMKRLFVCAACRALISDLFVAQLHLHAFMGSMKTLLFFFGLQLEKHNTLTMDILPRSLHCCSNVEWTWDKIGIAAQTLTANVSGGINKWKPDAVWLFGPSQFVPFMTKVITQEIKFSDLEAVWHQRWRNKNGCQWS